MRAIVVSYARGGETDDVRELHSPAPQHGNAFAVDWIKVAVAPAVMRVEGCDANKYYADENRVEPTAGGLVRHEHVTNHFLKSHSYSQAPWSDHRLPYASTYNCLRGGGQTVRLRGKHLGSKEGGAAVTIGGASCLDVTVVVPEYELACTLPPRAWGEAEGRDLEVRVTLGDLPLLSGAAHALSYAVAPPTMRAPTLANIAARSMDVSWVPPGDVWDQLTVKGARFVRLGAEKLGEPQRTNLRRRCDEMRTQSGRTKEVTPRVAVGCGRANALTRAALACSLAR